MYVSVVVAVQGLPGTPAFGCLAEAACNMQPLQESRKGSLYITYLGILRLLWCGNVLDIRLQLGGCCGDC